MLALGPLDAAGKVALQTPRTLQALGGWGEGCLDFWSLLHTWWLPEGLPEIPALHDLLALLQLGPTRGGECPAGIRGSSLKV